MAYNQNDSGRKRKNRISFYLTDQELELVNKKMKKTNHTNMNSYIRDSILNGIIVIRNYNTFRSVVNEINKIGTNINQAVKLANTKGDIYKTEIKYLENNMQQIWNLLSDSIK